MSLSIPYTLAVAVLVLVGLGIATATASARYEEPAYTVVAQLEGAELRDYGPRLYAQVTLPSERERSADSAFRILAAYIFNKDTPSGEAIGMTVPVGQYSDPGDDAWSMWFAMPSRYTIDTLPPVTDGRITIKEQPAQRVAALAFSGRRDRRDFSAQTEELLASIRGAGLTAVGPPTLAVYNGPLTPGPFRRNEVLVVVE